MKIKIIYYFLMLVFFLIYLTVFDWIWRFLPISSSLTVLFGTIAVLFIALLLAIFSARKVLTILGKELKEKGV